MTTTKGYQTFVKAVYGIFCCDTCSSFTCHCCIQTNLCSQRPHIWYHSSRYYPGPSAGFATDMRSHALPIGLVRATSTLPFTETINMHRLRQAWRTGILTVLPGTYGNMYGPYQRTWYDTNSSSHYVHMIFPTNQVPLHFPAVASHIW